MEFIEPMSTVFFACREALLEIKKLKICREDMLAGEIDAKVGFSWRSFGEEIIVRLQKETDNKCLLIVRSQPRKESTVADYGKGVENVETFVHGVRNAIKSKKDLFH